MKNNPETLLTTLHVAALQYYRVAWTSQKKNNNLPIHLNDSCMSGAAERTCTLLSSSAERWKQNFYELLQLGKV